MMQTELVPELATLPEESPRGGGRGGREGAARWALGGVVLIALAAVVLLLYETRPRYVTGADGTRPALIAVNGAAAPCLGMNADGCTYLGASRNVAAGRGANWAFGPIDQPLIHFPPLFPLVVGGLARVTGGEALAVGRWLHAGLLGLMIGLLGWTVWRVTRSGAWAVGAAGFLLLTRDLLESHANFMSEPLFIALGFAGLLLLDRGIRRQWVAGMVGIGLLMGATCWVRYAGVGFIVTGVLAIGTPLGADLVKRRWRAAGWRAGQLAAFSVPAYAATRALLVYNMHYNHGLPFNREFVWQAANFPHVWNFFGVVARWFIPTIGPNLPWWAVLPCYVLVVAGLILPALWAGRGGAARGGDREARSQKPGARSGVSAVPAGMLAVLWFIPVYIGLMLFSILGVRPAATPIEERLALPLLLPLVLTLAWLGHGALQGSRSRAAGVLGGLVVLLLAGSNLSRLNNWLGHRAEERYLFFSAPPWTDSPLLAAVRELPAGSVRYGNGCDVLYYLTGQQAVWIPKSSLAPEEEFTLGVEEMRARLAAGDGYVAMFDQHWFQYYGAASEAELVWAVPLELVRETEDGRIYRLRRGEGEMRGQGDRGTR